MWGIIWKEQRERKYEGVNNHFGGSLNLTSRKPTQGWDSTHVRWNWTGHQKTHKFQNWSFQFFYVFIAFISFLMLGSITSRMGQILPPPCRKGAASKWLIFQWIKQNRLRNIPSLFFPKTSSEYEVKWVWHGPFYILTHPPSPILKRKTDLSVCPYLLTKDQWRW